MLDEHTIDDAQELVSYLNGYKNSFIYRGHSSRKYKLEASLDRLLFAREMGEWKQFEDHSLEMFCSKFHLYDNRNRQPNSKLAWLSIMQHYGVPTRLLDFSTSPYVALYFALEGYRPGSNLHPSIYCINYTELMEVTIGQIRNMDAQFDETRASVHAKNDQIFEKIADRYTLPVVWSVEPAEMNARLDRQMGSFLFSGKPGMSVENVLCMKEYEAVTVDKLILDPCVYEGAFDLLRKTNVTGKSIYGDLEGLARSIQMELSAYALPGSEKDAYGS